MSGSIWERFSLDPREGAHASMRASDRDRDVVNDVLGTAYAEGRLTAEELDERGDLVVTARTLGELPPLLADLVAPSGAAVPVVRDTRAEAERRYRQQRRKALFSFLTPTLICWIIYVSLLVGGNHTWFPWPAFVMIGTGRWYFQLATSKEDSIASIQRGMEKKERKRLETKQAEDAEELGHKPTVEDDPTEDS